MEMISTEMEGAWIPASLLREGASLQEILRPATFMWTS